MNWSDDSRASLFIQDDVKVTSQLALDAVEVKGMNLTEDAFRAWVNEEDATVPANVDLTVNLKAPENQYFIADDTISFPANTDDGAVELSDTSDVIKLVDPNDFSKQVAEATVSDGALTIKLLESAFEGEPSEPVEPSIPSDEQGTSDTTDGAQTTPGGEQSVNGQGGTDQGGADSTVEVGGSTNEPVDQGGATATDGNESADTPEDAVVEGGATEPAMDDNGTMPTGTEEATASTLASRSAANGGESTPAYGTTVSMKATFDASVLASALRDDADPHEWTLIKDKGFKAAITTPSLDGAVDTLKSVGAFVQEPEPTIPEEGEKPEESEEPSDPGENDKLALSDYTASSALTTVWCDNMSADRPGIEKVEGGYRLYFALESTDGVTTTYIPLTEDNLGKLGLQEMPSWAEIETTSQSTNEYVASATGLPTTLTKTTTTPAAEEGKEPVITTETFEILWQVHDGNSFDATYAGYMRMEDAYGEPVPENTQYLQKVADVWFGIEAKIGGEDPAAFFKSEGPNFLFHATANGDSVLPEGKTVTVGDLITAGYLDWSEEEGALAGQLPAYTRDGLPIVYSITYEGKTSSEGGSDFYQVAYDNQNAPNHGSDTTAAYSGGIMTLRRLGTTTFDATKVWLDNNAENRPDATFTLWRYSANQENGYSIASQVQLAPKGSEALEYATITIGSEQSATEVENTIKNDDGNEAVEEIPTEEPVADTVDLGDLLGVKYGNQNNKVTLPKYDPDGYPYVYALREEASLQDYETVFGSVQLDENNAEKISDTAPNYYNAAGDKTNVSENWTRSDGERLIYNDGVVTNRLTGTVITSFTKTWVAATFQSQLDDIVCTFKAQSRIKGSTDETAWADVENNTDAEVDLKGWISESLTQTVTKSFPKYDSQGNELEYRWVEYSVTQDGEEKVLSEDGEFSLMLTDALGEENSVTFKSVVEGSTIENVFENKTCHHVEKIWLDENNNRIEAPGVTATVKLYRDHVLLNEDGFTLDGVIDEKAQEFVLDEGDLSEVTYTVREDAPWHLSIEGLPEYSESGAHYSYLVLEEGIEDWHTERTYDPTGYQHEGSKLGKPLTTIVNTRGPGGPTTDIPVSKTWLDDSDNDHRLPSVVQIVAKRDKDDGKGNTITAGKVVGYAVLTEEQGWYEEVTIPGAWNWQEDFELVEAGLADKNQEPEAAPGDAPKDVVKYLAYDSPDAVPEDEGGDWVNKGWSEDFGNKVVMPRIATDQHVYEVTNRQVTRAANGEIDSLNVKNRRIGLIDLTAVKIWKDGAGNEDERPEAVFDLTEVNGKATFSVDDSGNAYVKLVGGSTIPLFTDDKEATRLKGEVSDDGKTLTISIDNAASTNEETIYHINGLPKYDGNGEVATYNLEESFPEERGDYSSSKKTGEYVVNELHFHDTQDFTFTNKRVGSKSVTFHKVWKDAYVHEVLNQRPDIHLTLYRMANGKFEQVEGYVHYVWSHTKGENGEYYQDCTIDGLPKYDDNGEEIMYYASEAMSADAEALWYKPVQLTAPEGASAESTLDAFVNVKDSDQSTIADGALLPTGPDWAVIEGGTFTNALGGTITVEGTKLWENMPAGFQLEDLPEITIYLQQREVASEAEMAAPWQDMTVESGNPSEGEAPAGDPGSGYHVEGALAWTTLSGKDNGATTWKFTMTHEGANSGAEEADESTLPRFTEDGNLYQYRTREAIWGLMGTEGGFEMGDYLNDGTSTDGKPTDGTSTGEPATTNEVVSKVYKVTHGETGSFLMRNFYQSPMGELTVTKTFDGANRDEGDYYPDVTFELYRFYANDSESGISKPEMIKSHTFVGGDTELSGALEYTFENLEIYAPNGNKWRYFVVETPVGGYESMVAPVAGDSADKTYAKGIDGTASGVVTFDDEMTGGAIPTASVSFENAYKPNENLFDLLGKKEWQDYNNIFGSSSSVVRPDNIELSLERDSGKGQHEDVVLQSGDADEAAYLSWTEKDGDADEWTFTISNLERWAPDGTLWTYTVTEKDTNPDGYSIVTGSVSVKAGANEATVEFPALVNGLEGKLSVVKNWDDGNNQWGLRPGAIKVELQALTDNGVTWGNAYDVVSGLVSGSGDAFNEGLAAFKNATADKVLKADNWSASWGSLPVKVGSTDIQYRAVEVGMSQNPDIEVGSDSWVTVLADDEKVRAENDLYIDASQQGNKVTLSYETSQSTADGTTTIANKLQSTSLNLTKTWSDRENKWGYRPTNDSGAWTVTFLLQSKAGDGEWTWVTKSGALADDPNSSDVVKYTMSSTKLEGHTVTLENLPKYNANHQELTYRVVESVPTGYEVVSSESLSDDGALAVVSGDSMNDGQSFANELLTTGLEGTKIWSDYGTGLADEQNKQPTLILWRSTDDGTSKEIASKEQPQWSGDGDTWTYQYDNLPAVDKNSGKPYTYWVEEVVDEQSGFYPTYENSDAKTSDVITNNATRFKLDKVNDVDPKEQLNNVELAVESSDGETVYAIWRRSGDSVSSVTSSWVWPNGKPASEVWEEGVLSTDDAIDMSESGNAGYIIGLKAGTYKIVETGAVPENHVLADPVTLVIGNDGSIEANGASTDNSGLVTVEVVDKVFRAHVLIHKIVASEETGQGNPLKGVKFDLYRDNGGNGEDVLLATGIETGDQGYWSSRYSDVAYIEGTMPRYYGHLSDGLPIGSYYLKETGGTPAGVAANAVFEFEVTDESLTADETAHGITGEIVNGAFAASIQVPKYDAQTGARLANVPFELQYVPEGSSKVENLGIFKTSDTGLLAITSLKKGTYTLTEKAHGGYVSEGAFQATFTIENGDEEMAFDLTNENHRKMIDFKVTKGAFDEEKGIPNNHTTVGADSGIMLQKVGEDGRVLNGARFSLDVQNGDSWSRVASDLTTGMSYAFDEDKAAISSGTEGEPGVLKVTNLQWGTYRLVETHAPSGYLCISDPLVIAVSEDGTITKVEGDAAYTVSEDGVRITAVDPERPSGPDPDDPDEPDPDEPDPDNPDPDNPDPDNPPDPDEPDPDNPDPDSPDPDNPNPDNPSDPDNPNPDTPGNPDNPGPNNPDPNTPTPNKPTNPTPATPTKTTTPVKKTTPAKSASVVAMAKTGDPLAMAALGSGISALVAAALALAVLTVRKRRER